MVGARWWCVGSRWSGDHSPTRASGEMSSASLVAPVAVARRAASPRHSLGVARRSSSAPSPTTRRSAQRHRLRLRASSSPDDVSDGFSASDEKKSAAAARAALLESWPDPSARETTTPSARRAKGNESSPFRLESRLKKPRGASDAPRAARDGRRVSWDVPPAPPRANAATPRTEPRKKTKKKARLFARREDGF